MNLVQENLFQLLIELDDICNKYDIDYCLAGGTALGALRNQCFLPWDDDIDLYITRDNWIKLRDLIEANPEVLPENRNFVCMENDPYYRNPIARYVDTRTTAIYPTQSISGRTCGVQIELFILDPIPNVEDGQEDHLKQMRAYLEVLSPYFMACKSIPIENYAEHRDLVLEIFDRIDSEGYDKVMGELYDKLYTYPLEKADTFCLRWGKRTLLHKTKFYSQKRYIQLEDREFPVAYELEHALRVDYGDTWMYIPDNEGKLSHNPWVEDPNRTFEDFTKIYQKFIDRDKIVKVYEADKRVNVNLWIPRRKISMEKMKLKSIMAKLNIHKLIEINNYDAADLLKNEDYDTLNMLFEEYYSFQLNQTARKYNILVDLEDMNLVKIAVESKIRQGQYYVANNILNIVEHNIGFDDDFQHYKDVCVYCKRLSKAIYDDHDLEALEDTLNNGFDDFSKIVDNYRARLHLDLNRAKDDDDYRLLIDEGNEMLKEYPNDGEIMAYIAQAYYLLGDNPKASEMYDEAVHNTRNGFVWNDAKKYVGIDRMAEEEIDDE